MENLYIFFVFLFIVYFVYTILQVQKVRVFFGKKEQKEENTSFRVLIFVFIYIVIIWSLLAISEYVFLNESNKSLFTYFELTNNPNRILARFVMIASIMAAGVVVSKIFSRLVKEEKRYKENAENLRVTLESIGDAVITTDTKGCLTNMNAIAEKLTGWKKEEAKGKRLEEVFQIINDKTKKIVINPVEKVLKSKKIVILANHTILISKTNVEYQIGDSAAPIFDVDNNIIGVILVFRDVTKEYELINKLEESEQRWQFALDGSRSGVWDYNLLTGKVYYSFQWKNMLGYEDDEIDNDYKEWESRVHPDDLEFMTNKVANFIKSDKKFFEATHRLRCKDGSYRWILVKGKAINRAKDNKPQRIIGTHNDVTKDVEAQKELKEKDELMISQSGHAAMGEMISMIAHQWRQPLSVISMRANNILVDVKLDALDTESLVTDIKDICFHVQELSKTIDDFRDFFKPVKTVEEVCIEDVYYDSYRVMSKSLQYDSIEVITDFSSKQKIKTYSRELMQVIINILKNSKEAMEKKDIQHKKILVKTDVDENGISISFCDNAGGIDKDIILKIFDPYFSTKSSKNGAGLGLYMCKTIVEKHLKGEIKAYNKDDGVCFVISLPFSV